MSFSIDIKNEVSRIDGSKEELISELSAIIRNSALVDDNIIIYIENNSVARRIFKLFKSIYEINPIITVRKKFFNNGYSYILTIKNKKNEILNDLSIIKENKYLDIPYEYIVSDDDLIRAYLRGLFLVSGSINDPKTSRYHLEFLVDSYEYAKFISRLLNRNDLNSKIIKREKKYMVYIKEAEKISDFLRIIRAYNGVMYYEDIRIYRDHKNMTNRLNNCEQANMDKIFFTATNQIKDIEKLNEYDLMDIIDEKLKVVIDYRLKYPEASLSELSDIMSNDGIKITKSGLNHRFRKIKEMILNIENKE
ncbi:MAG: DNA-binding protein WhiA [Bacilli bacterium]|nr:DNA-binding protein WhiA [Bacilli bacterium]